MTAKSRISCGERGKPNIVEHQGFLMARRGRLTQTLSRPIIWSISKKKKKLRDNEIKRAQRKARPPRPPNLNQALTPVADPSTIV